jgi:hypothetical protein
MPETAVDKNGDPLGGKDDVRAATEVRLFSKPKSELPQRAADHHFRFGVASTDP